jgi:PAS domain S-box-containing protein
MAGLGYWHYDAVSGQMTWSDEIYQIYGLDPADGPPTIGALDDLCHPDDRPKLAEHRRVNDGKDAEIEVRIIRPDGEVRNVIAKSTVRRDAAGATLERFGVLTDVTEMKRAEAAARQSEARYRFLAEHAPDMIARVAPEGEIRYISPSCERVFGYTPEEHMKLTPMDMTHPDDLPGVAAAIMGMVERRQTRLEEPLCYRARHKDGRSIWVEAKPILILDDQGEPLEFVDIIRDVTQTKMFEAELKQARADAEAAAAAKSTFLANMSHELRTPLTSIIGFARLLQDRRDLSSEAGHYAKRIADASDALLAIINDVLDFSKLEAGQVTLEQLPLSVRRLVEETTGLIAIQAAAKGLEVHTELDASAPPLIVGDVARLRQVLLNFLSNAVKFTSEGSVTVKTVWRETRGGPMLKISVADTGAGIAPENLERLFERFSQTDVSINRTHGGTGLGLAISKGIIGLMGGRVGVRSKPGQGSTFWFETPAAAAELVETIPDTEASEAVCGSLRILMVDDTAVNRELVRMMLQPLGFEIDEAAGGAEGVQAAMVHPYDLILMDVRMPGVDGLEAARVIRATSEANRRTPIIALTADVQPENAAACRAAGMDDVLAKPIVPQQLLAAIVSRGGRDRDEPLAQAV